jgi:hypothetical protein
MILNTTNCTVNVFLHDMNSSITVDGSRANERAVFSYQSGRGMRDEKPQNERMGYPRKSIGKS